MAHGYYKNYKKSDKYKYVGSRLATKNKLVWNAMIFGKTKTFDNERDAAKWVDLRLIEKGKEPVNILVRK